MNGEARKKKKKTGCLRDEVRGTSCKLPLWRGLSCHELVGSKRPLWDGRRGGSKRSRNEADGILIARQMA